MESLLELPSRVLNASNGTANKLLREDQSAHDWYRFVLSFPPQLVRHYVQSFGLSRDQVVLDPFSGTGTTVVECKKLGIPSVGIEANPIAHFASCVKTDWAPEPEALVEHAQAVARRTKRKFAAMGIDDDSLGARGISGLRALPEDVHKLLLKNSISPLPLHKTLVLLDEIGVGEDESFYEHELLALAKALVFSISNLHFGPEVGVGVIKKDAPVIAPWLSNVRVMAEDLKRLAFGNRVPAKVFNHDARGLTEVLGKRSIDAVITSPPYPNEKDYSRTTRLESVILGFIRSKEQLRDFKKTLVRSNTRSIYRGDDDDRWIANHPEIHELAEKIEARRVSLGKTSGFERMYPRVTKLYFGGMARHLSDLRQALRPGARLAYVVGDQASYLRVMIRTGKLLGDIARSLGYELERIDLFRTRLATATREQLREEVVVLRWPGN